MHNKDVCSPSSEGGFGIGVNTVGRMQSNAGAFASLYSAPTNENLPSLAGNCSNGGGVSLYPCSDSGTDITSPVKMHIKDVCSPEDEVETLQQKNGQLRTEKEELQKKKITQSINPTNQNQPDDGKCSNEGGVSFYPYSEAGTDFNLLEIQNNQDTVNHPEKTSKNVEALQQDNDLNLSKRKLLPRRAGESFKQYNSFIFFRPR